MCSAVEIMERRQTIWTTCVSSSLLEVCWCHLEDDRPQMTFYSFVTLALCFVLVVLTIPIGTLPVLFFTLHK